MKTVGVLALQGDFEAHRSAVLRAVASSPDFPEVQVAEVRTAAQLAACDGLIIPGGESTTMLKLLEVENLMGPLRDFASCKPVYGSCAGAILLARDVMHPPQPSLGLLDIAVERNAYGRQADSRIAKITTEDGSGMQAVFIRAPIIRRVAGDVIVLADYEGNPVWVEQGRHMVTTFHPELSLSGDTRVHQRFLRKL